MVRTVVRTLLVGLITGFVLGVLLLPALDAVGRMLAMPPVFHLAARVLLLALWLAGMKAAWSYEPAEDPVDPSAHAGGP